MAKTSQLSINLLYQNQSQKELFINEALIMIDGILNNAVKSIVNILPENPSNGDLYIVSDKSVGELVNYAFYIAYYYDSWRYIKPNIGITFWVKNEEKFYIYDESGWNGNKLSVNKGTLNQKKAEGKINIDIGLLSTAKLQVEDDIELKFLNENESLTPFYLLLSSDHHYNYSFDKNIKIINSHNFGDNRHFIELIILDKKADLTIAIKKEAK